MPSYTGFENKAAHAPLSWGGEGQKEKDRERST